MTISSQLLLTFLLNACWQVALIAALASLGSWLLRNSNARYRHWVWVSALCLAFLVPAVTSARTFFESELTTNTAFALQPETIAPFSGATTPAASAPVTVTVPSSFRLNQTLGLALLG